MSNLPLIRILMINTHITAGFISLISFWLIILLAKKTYLHTQLGNLYLISIICITISTMVNNLILKMVVHFTYDSKIIFDMLTLLFFTFAALLTYISTHVPIWIISKKNELNNLVQSKMLNFFIGLSFVVLLAGIIASLLNFFNSPILLINGFLLTPYVLIPIIKELFKLKHARVLNFDIVKFHINTLITGGIILHASFLAGGANLRYFKKDFNYLYLMGLTFVLMIIFRIFNAKIIHFFKKNL